MWIHDTNYLRNHKKPSITAIVYNKVKGQEKIAFLPNSMN